MAGNLRVKEVPVAPGGAGDGDGGVRAARFVVCHNPDQATRDAAVRDALVEHLQSLIDGSDTWTGRRRDELVGGLKGKPGLRRHLRRTGTGLLRIDHAAIGREAHLGCEWLLRTRDPTLTAEASPLLLIRVVENATGDTWRSTTSDRMHLVTLATADGRVGATLSDHPRTEDHPRRPRPARTTPIPWTPPVSSGAMTAWTRSLASGLVRMLRRGS